MNKFLLFGILLSLYGNCMEREPNIERCRQIPNYEKCLRDFDEKIHSYKSAIQREQGEIDKLKPQIAQLEAELSQWHAKAKLAQESFEHLQNEQIFLQKGQFGSPASGQPANAEDALVAWILSGDLQPILATWADLPAESLYWEFVGRESYLGQIKVAIAESEAKKSEAAANLQRVQNTCNSVTDAKKMREKEIHAWELKVFLEETNKQNSCKQSSC